MSTFAYATLTSKREKAQPGQSEATSPGVQTYVDALASLVPAEVLSVHAVMLTFTTDTDGQGVTKITQPGALQFVFWALVVLSMVIYVSGKWKQWDQRWGYIRVLIPPLAFVGWTMLQKSTAFDAVAPGMNSALRDAIAIIGAVVLGIIAAQLAYKADQRQPPA